MDLACPKEHAQEILSDSDYPTKVESFYRKQAVFFPVYFPSVKSRGAFDSTKNASANAANAKVRNRQMIGRPIIL